MKHASGGRAGGAVAPPTSPHIELVKAQGGHCPPLSGAGFEAKQSLAGKPFPKRQLGNQDKGGHRPLP